MTTPAFRPFGKRVLVLPKEIETKSVSAGDYTIESEKPLHEKPAEGVIVAAGKDVTECRVGDTVLFGKYSGYEQVLDGVTYIVLQETELLGEVIKTPFDLPL